MNTDSKYFTEEYSRIMWNCKILIIIYFVNGIQSLIWLQGVNCHSKVI